MKRTWKFWIGLVGIFFFGLVLGVFIGAGSVQGWIKKLATAPRGELETLVLEDWKKKLNLREEQLSALRPMLGSAEAKILPLRDNFLGRVGGILTDLHPQIRAVLDEKQRKKYDEMVRRYERRLPESAKTQAAAVATPNPN